MRILVLFIVISSWCVPTLAQRHRCAYRLAGKAPQMGRMQHPFLSRDDHKRQKKKKREKKKEQKRANKPAFGRLTKRDRVRNWVMQGCQIAVLSEKFSLPPELVIEKLTDMALVRINEIQEATDRSNQISTHQSGQRDLLKIARDLESAFIIKQRTPIREALQELLQLGRKTEESEASLARQKQLLRLVLYDYGMAKDNFSHVDPGEVWLTLVTGSPTYVHFAIEELQRAGLPKMPNIESMLETRPAAFTDSTWRSSKAYTLGFFGCVPELAKKHLSLIARSLDEDAGATRFLAALVVLLNTEDKDLREKASNAIEETFAKLDISREGDLARQVIARYPHAAQLLDPVIRKVVEKNEHPYPVVISISMASNDLLNDPLVKKHLQDIVDSGATPARTLVTLTLLQLPEREISEFHIELLVRLCKQAASPEDPAFTEVRKGAIRYLLSHRSFEELVELYLQAQDPGLFSSIAVQLSFAYENASEHPLFALTADQKKRLRADMVDSESPAQVMGAMVVLSRAKELAYEDAVAMRDAVARMFLALRKEYHEFLARIVSETHYSFLPRAIPFFVRLLDDAVRNGDKQTMETMVFLTVASVDQQEVFPALLRAVTEVLGNHPNAPERERAERAAYAVVDTYDLQDEAEAYVAANEGEKGATALAFWFVRTFPNAYRPAFAQALRAAQALGHQEISKFLEEKDAKKRARQERRAGPAAKEAAKEPSRTPAPDTEPMTCDKAVTDLNRCYGTRAANGSLAPALNYLLEKSQGLDLNHIRELVHLARNADVRLADHPEFKKALEPGLKAILDGLPLSKVMGLLRTEQISDQGAFLYLLARLLNRAPQTHTAAQWDELGTALVRVITQTYRDQVRREASRLIPPLLARLDEQAETWSALTEHVREMSRHVRIPTEELRLLAAGAGWAPAKQAQEMLDLLRQRLSIPAEGADELDPRFVQMVSEAGRDLLDEKGDPRVRLALATVLYRIPGYDTPEIAEWLNLAEEGNISEPLALYARQAREALENRRGPAFHASIAEEFETDGVEVFYGANPFELPPAYLAMRQEGWDRFKRTRDNELLQRASERESMYAAILSEAMPRTPRGYGRFVMDVSRNPRRGFDLLSIDFRTGEIRQIEVKGKFGGSKELAISRYEARMANQPDPQGQTNYYVCVVQLDVANVVGINFVKNPKGLHEPAELAGYLRTEGESHWFELEWFLTPRRDGGHFFVERLSKDQFPERP